MIETIKIKWHINIHFLSERATTCIAALNVRLTMQKNSIRNRPLTPFFATSVEHSELLCRPSNCGI